MQEIHQEPLAIIGIGCRFPGANNPQEFWELLRSGRSAIRDIPIDRWQTEKLYHPDPAQPGKMVSCRGGFLDQVDRFDPSAFGMLASEVRSMDPQQRLLLEVAWEAFEDAGLPFSELAGSKTSVSIGIGWNDYLRLLTSNWSKIDRYMLTGNATSVAANRLSYAFDLRGPSVAIDVGCTSSLSAVYLACQSLWTKEADLALAGGVHLLLSPDGSLIISKAGFLSAEGTCRAMDATANGTVLGEGAGVVILKRLSQVCASDRVYAMIYSVETNHNGHTDKIIAPDQAAQVALLRIAYRNAGVNAAEIDYAELHGMGFLHGDAVEANALSEALHDSPERTHPCLIGSVKTNIGDLESAAGIASLIKVALSLYHQEIPPSLNFERYNPSISLQNFPLEVSQTTQPWPEKDTVPLASVTTLALAGANAHAILARPASLVLRGSRKADAACDDEEQIFPFSAHTEKALSDYAVALQAFLHNTENSQASWRDICYTATMCRTHRQQRCAVVARTPREAAVALDAFLRESSVQSISQGEVQDTHLVFFFPHQSLTLSYRDYGHFSKERGLYATLIDCDRIIQKYMQISILDEITNSSSSHSAATRLSPLAVFALQIAQVDQWYAWGILPDAVAGEGWGEIAAAYAAGVLSLEDAFSLIAQHTDHVDAVSQKPLTCYFYSATSGLLSSGGSFSKTHWKNWQDGGPAVLDLQQVEMRLLSSEKHSVMLEIGPHSAFPSALLSHAQKQGRATTRLPSFRDEQSLKAYLLQTLSTLYTFGRLVNWSAFYNQRSSQNCCVSLPNFPWQRERFWFNWLTVEEISTPPEMKRALPPPEESRIEDHTLSALPLEQLLTVLWAEVLGIEHIDANANFFELGGHSLLATQLLTRIRAVCQINMPLDALLDASTPATCAAFILQKRGDETETGHADLTLPEVQKQPSQRSIPFPTTEVQQAYWLGREVPFESIRVGNHGYIEVEAREIDVSRFNGAVQHLVERHEMLRAIMLPDGQQQIIETVPPFAATVIDLRDKAAAEGAAIVGAIREEMDHQMLPVDRWPAFDIRIVLLDEQHTRIHLSLEVLFVDAWSTHLLIQEFLQFYLNPAVQLPTLELSFRDYVLAETQLSTGALYQQSEQYWKQRIATLPPAPDLPMLQNVSSETPRRFVHREGRLDEKSWSRLKTQAARAGLTPSGFLLTAFAEVIGAWSKNSRFCLNLSVFHRLPLHPQVNNIVGDFTSLIMLAVDHSAPETFEQRASRIQKQLWSDLDHSFYNGVSVLRDLAQMQGSMAQAFMPIVFTSLLIQDVANTLPAPWQETLYCVSQSPQVFLDHQVLESGGKLVLHWQSVDALFPPGLFDDMFAAYCQLLNTLACDESSWRNTHLSVLPEAQRQLYARVHQNKAPITDHLLHTLFAAQVVQRPEHVAIISERRTLTYKEVSIQATFLARRLRQLGARPNHLVAIVMEKGWEQVIAALSILQSGAAYLPIDPSLPPERLLYMLEHAEVSIVLTQSWIELRVDWPASLQRICVDREDRAATQREILPLEPLQDPGDLAYVIYTSGSTGQPKGVMIDHRGAVNTILDINERFAVTNEDRVLALSALNFDLSVYDLFGILAAGGAIVIPSEDTASDPRAWFELVTNERVTIWNTVPALMQMLVEYVEDHNVSLRNTRLRLALLSGDWIPLSLPAALQVLKPHISVISLGGATEASIWSILYPITAIDPAWKSIPYGQSMKNQRIAVLNERLEPCSVWVPGPLYIAGTGVALGYWHDAEKTKRSFILHPVTYERLYRTGDLGRYLPDGNIEFLGREDFQVKIRGYRIELGEIEAALLSHEAVHATIMTTYNETDQASNQQLVAYVIPEQSSDKTIAFQTPDAFQEYFAGATLSDPIERAAFKLRQPAIRHGDSSHYVQLTRSVFDDNLVARYVERRSHRQFDHDYISLQQFSDFLSCLYQIEVDGLFKYRYASTGGLYAVQAYLYIKPERIEGLAGGIYYYHPQEHRLVLLTPDAHIDATVHVSYNQQIFQDSAFSLFLIAHLDAIEPLYGKAARDYCLLDAGYMSHQLMLSLDTHQIGICPVGDLDFKRIRHLFALQEKDLLIHSLIGGKALPLTAHKNVVTQEALYQEAMDHKKRASSLVHELATFLRAKLPAYMVPASFVLLEKFPLTANGKIDRRSLPKPTLEVPVTEKETFVAPRTPIERRLEQIWVEILKVDAVGVHDNFFKLGGHSLLATRIMLRILDTFDVELPLRTLFDAPTLAELAPIIEKTAPQRVKQQALVALPQVIPAPEQRYQLFPLTDLQQAYVLGRADMFELGNVSTHLYQEFESDRLDLERLAVAWQKLIQRHDMLRVIILPEGQQQVLAQVPPYHIETQDLRGCDLQYVQSQLEALRQRLSHQVLEADRWPLFEIRAILLDQQRTRLFISIDALAYDYFSWHILYRELSDLYENPEVQLTPLELTFRDYILTEATLEQTEWYQRAQDYWWKRLPNLYPAPELPAVKRSTVLSQSHFVRRKAQLSRNNWQQLKILSTQAGVTPSVVLLTVLAEVMAAWSKTPRFTINVPRTQRLPLHPQVNSVVGVFSSFILLEVDCSGTDSFIERAKRIQAQLWDDINHQYINGVRIIRELIRLRGGFSGPLMPIVFTSTLGWEKTLISDEPQQAVLLDKILTEVYSITQTPQVWIDQQVFEHNNTLFFNWDSIDELFPTALLDDMFAAYCNLLESLLDERFWHESVPALLPATQLAQRERINNTMASIPDDLLHSLFARQARLYPDHPAIISNHLFTYRDLSILNERLQPCPVWVPGEIYCASVELAKGYPGDEERTQARFIPHSQTGECIYRTGNWGRYLPDGTIEFLGEDDFQVKIRSHRRKPGEMEAALPTPQTGEIAAPGKKFAPPRNAVEEVVAKTWIDLFGLKQVGIYDNFFDLGGHSMLATKIIARLRELFQGRFSIRTLLEVPTIAGMAEALVANEKTPGQAEKIARLQMKINAMSADEVQRLLKTKGQKG